VHWGPSSSINLCFAVPTLGEPWLLGAMVRRFCDRLAHVAFLVGATLLSDVGSSEAMSKTCIPADWAVHLPRL
jgi:hypothetical protein